MDAGKFLKEVGEAYYITEPDDLGNDKYISVKVRVKLDIGKMIYGTKRTRAQAHSTILELLNDFGRNKIFRYVRGVTMLPDFQYKFGSKDWFFLVYAELYEEVLPLTNQSVKDEIDSDFFIKLYNPTTRDYWRYRKVWIDSGYPVFSEDVNNRLRTTAQRTIDNGLTMMEQAEVWVKRARIYYRVYFQKVAEIYLLWSPKNPNGPEYRLLRSLGIAPDQRVFLAEQVNNSKKRVVVKWEEEGDSENGLDNWLRVQSTGMHIPWFDATYHLTYNRRVLVTEFLNPIDHTDDIVEFLSQTLRELQVLHSSPKGPYVHADLKLDNILKRVNADGSRDYLIIDWDALSHRPYAGVHNSVEREAFSPIWTSQTPGNKPTSYRYDLQELFYASVDLVKKRNTANRVKPVPLWMADSDTLLAEQEIRGIGIPEIRSQMQVSHLPGVGKLYYLFPLIMDLPERAPAEEINYDHVIEYVEIARSSRKVSSSVSVEQTIELETMPEKICAHCERPIVSPLDITNEAGDAVAVCNIVCAALCNPEKYYEKAIAHKAVYGKVRIRRNLCENCGSGTDMCCQCGTPYCGTECQQEDFDRHRNTCVDIGDFNK